MTVLNFPADTSQSPYEENGVVYVWDGQAWVSDGGTEQYLPISGGTVTGDITVNGNSGVGGDLTVDGNSNVGGDLTVDGNSNVGGDLTVVGDIQTTSFNGGQLAGFRNQIINGDFRVWQRGTGPFDTTVQMAYTADRWVVATGFNGMQRSNNAPSGFVHSMSLPANAILQQGIELDLAGSNGAFANGSTWTLSIWSTQTPAANAEFIFRNEVGSGLNQVNAGPSTAWVDTGETNNGFTRFAATVTLNGDAGATNVCLELQIFAGSAATEITGIQFEPGPVATPFEIRPIGTELALCQRYYYRVANKDFSVSTNLDVSRNNAYRMFTPHPVEMRDVSSADITVTQSAPDDRAQGDLGINSATDESGINWSGDIAAGSGVANWTNVAWQVDAEL